MVNKSYSSLSPVVLEDSKFNAVGVDVYTRLLKDNIIYFGGDVSQESCNIVIAQLLYLSNRNPYSDITMYINSQGGSVIDGLAVVDTMRYIPNDIVTVCVGCAASMGAVLLSCGTKGKRYALPHSRIMIHQVSSEIKGTYKDMEIAISQTERCKNDVYTILSQTMGKSMHEIDVICDRDRWFVGEEAVDAGIIDKII